MDRQTMHVELGPRTYEIAFAYDRIPDCGAFFRHAAGGTQALVVADANVAQAAARVRDALAQAGYHTALAAVTPGEERKSLESALHLYDRLIDLPADRKTLVVAVGGGVIGDLAGFVAATYARGLPLAMVPTTLLAMVDSSVGGKVAVNHPRGKNMIGVFHQPRGVWIDIALLDTLPEREYRSGLAEVVKYGVILDADFFHYLEENADAILRRDRAALMHIIQRSCRLKADVVEKDEREETGLRVILNYGHTFAHAFEQAAGYGAWLHGEAVAAGMACAGRLAQARGLIDAETVARQERLLGAFGLPTTIPAWPGDALLKTMRTDKKSLAGRLRFIVPTCIGAVRLVDDVPEDDVRRVLNSA